MVMIEQDTLPEHVPVRVTTVFVLKCYSGLFAVVFYYFFCT